MRTVIARRRGVAVLGATAVVAVYATVVAASAVSVEPSWPDEP